MVTSTFKERSESETVMASSSVWNKPSVDDVQHQHKVLGIHLELAQFPILARKIREQMRQELFAKGIITVDAFEAEVQEKAVLSQRREGMSDPLVEEPAPIWNDRLAAVRDQVTDFYFAYNMPPDRLGEIVESVLADRVPPQELELGLTFNPELAPWDLLFAQGEEFESLPPKERSKVQHHLQEIIVVLIKGMISDRLNFVGLAKELFTIQDLKEIRRRRIGRGKIGGKAAGMMLAWKIVQLAVEEDEIDVREYVQIPDSYFIGADVFYDFLSLNGFSRLMNQKYKPADEMEADYPGILAAYADGHFPKDIVHGLTALLEDVGDAPLIVRSSSLLEDNFGTAFAGKYESFFCPNQGSPEENLDALMDAVKRVYASALKPDALLYRRRTGLVDYDERMAVLIQKVQGMRYRHYFFPMIAGVGYSRNPFRWNPMIRREDGFVRLVWGMGTRAVERVANDYPRIIALSHPHLRPEANVGQVRKYSQHFVDLVDLEDNSFKTLPVSEVVAAGYPALNYLVSVDKGGYLTPLISRLDAKNPADLVLTFDRLAQDKRFITLMKALLQKLERRYKWPVDIEFTVSIHPKYPQADYTIRLLQCRPLVSQEWTQVEIPADIPEQDVILRACRLVPQGIVSGIRYIVYIDPLEYSQVPDHVTKLELARVIGRLNKCLEGERFILVGPGRWGSSNLDLGVKVTYADIYNARVLVEVPLAKEGSTAEASYGTHFFQDLVESGIFPLPIVPGEDGAMLNYSFLAESPNVLADLLPEDAAREPYVQVIDVPAASGGRYLEIVMNGERERAVGYLRGIAGDIVELPASGSCVCNVKPRFPG
jgi:hypothetical protein